MSFIDFKENGEFKIGRFIKKDDETGLTHVSMEDGTEKQITKEMIVIDYQTSEYVEFIRRQQRGYDFMKTKPFDFDNEFIKKFEKHCILTQDELVVQAQDEMRSKEKIIKDLPDKYYDDIGIRQIKNAVSEELCDQINDVVNKKFETRGDDDCTQLSFGLGRYELKLKNEGPVADMIKHLHDTVIKTDYDTHSITCFVSDPGSKTQPYHRDFAEHDMYCIFVALQDMTHEMGPPVFLPYTNSDVFYENYMRYMRIGDMIKNQYYEATIKKGDAILFDVRLLHAGRGNNSDIRRNMIAFTYRS